MAIKKTAFGSDAEKRGYYQLKSRWSDRCNIYPQFPFSAIFEPDDQIKHKSNIFFKTSVDYVICDKEDRFAALHRFPMLYPRFGSGVPDLDTGSRPWCVSVLVHKPGSTNTGRPAATPKSRPHQKGRPLCPIRKETKFRGAERIPFGPVP